MTRQHPFRIDKKVLYWACQLAGWSLLGVYTILVNGGASVRKEVVFDTLFTMGGLMLLSHGYRIYIIRNGWLKIIFQKLILRIIVVCFVLAVLATPISLLSSFLFNREQFAGNFETDAILLNIIAGIFIFFGWSLCYFLYHYVTNYNRNLKWEALINEFELNQLKSQLNPHFIFNALNSVKALVDENPDKAKDSITQLSNILRSSLMMDKKKVIPFDEELALVKDYLALEQTRYEERLQLAYDIHPGSGSFKVPPLMVQTLVENGIKHGISRYTQGGIVHLSTNVQEDTLYIKIRNTGEYKPANQRKEGYGLKSTRQRLDLLFHRKASFDIVNEGEKMVLTTVALPRWDEGELVAVQRSENGMAD